VEVEIADGEGAFRAARSVNLTAEALASSAIRSPF